MDDRSASRADLLVVEVHYRYLDGVDLALLALGDVGRQGKVEPSFPVGLTISLGQELAVGAHVGLILTVVIIVEAVVPLPLPPVEEERLAHHSPVDSRAGNGTTEEVGGLGSGSDGVALNVVGLIQTDLDLEFGLAILGDLEIDGERERFVHGLDVVETQGRIFAQLELAIDGAHIVDARRRLPELSALAVNGGQLDLAVHRRQRVLRVVVAPEDRLETHGLPGAIDPSISVQVGPVLLGHELAA